MSKTRLWSLSSVIVGLLALVAAGCGDDDEDSTSERMAPPTRLIEDGS